MAIFFRAWATMQKAGIPLVQCLETLEQSFRQDDPLFARDIARLIAQVQAGKMLSAALRRDVMCFRPIHRSLIAVGEQSGELDVVLERLADYEQTSYALRQRVSSALTYPIFLFVSAAFFLLVLVPRAVVPCVQQIAGGKLEQLPWVTQAIYRVSLGMERPLFWCALVGLLFYGKALWQRTKFRQKLRHVFELLPVVGPSLEATSMSNFFHAYHLQLEAGQRQHLALLSAAEVSGSEELIEQMRGARDEIGNGEALSRVFAGFPPVAQQLVRVGEESGRLAEMTLVLARWYEARLDELLAIALGLLEPFVMSVMGLICGIVLVGTLLPISRLVSTL